MKKSRRQAILFFLLATLLPVTAMAQVYWADGYRLRGYGTLGGDGSTDGISYTNIGHTYMDVYATDTGIIVNGNVDLRNSELTDTRSMCVYGDNNTSIRFNGANNYFLNVEVRNAAAADGANTVVFGANTSTNIAGTFIIGKDGGSGHAVVDVEQGATITGSANFTIGNSASKHGVMRVADGANVSTTGQIHVGSSGTGELYLANGNVTSGGNFYVGYYNDGTVYQTAGKITTNHTYFADNSTTTGEYYMSGTAELQVNQTLNIGQHGRGILDISGGKVNVTGATHLGNVSYDNIAAYGTLKVSQADGSTTNVTLAETRVGAANNARGEVIVEGGTMTTGAFYLGYAGNAVGTLDVSGSGNLTTGIMYVGYNSTGNTIDGTAYAGGTVTQTGGNVTASNLRVGDLAGSTGSYTLGNGTLKTTGTSVIGGNGTGGFTHTGGTFDGAGTNIYLGDQRNGDAAPGSGTYTMSGTTDGTKLNAARLVVGQRGNGTFIQNGGAVTLTENLSIGGYSGDGDAAAVGYYELNGGTVSSAQTYIGVRGTGTMTVDGGSLSTGAVRVGYGTDGTRNGTLNMKSGNITTTGAFRVGNSTNSTGIVNHSGGTIVIATETSLGYDSGSHGEYYMTGGDAVLRTVNFNIARGTNTTGYFEMSDGYLNYDATADSNTNGGGYLYVGNAGVGEAVVSGGEIFGWRIRVAEAAGSAGSSMKITGGLVQSHGSTTVGGNARGTLTHEGGTLNIGTSMVVSNSNDSAGSIYAISGDSTGDNATVLRVGQNMTVGYRGTGTVNQSGGVVTVGTTADHRLYIGTSSGTSTDVVSTGIYNLSGGTLNATTKRIYLGDFGSGTLNISGSGVANLQGIHIANSNNTNNSLGLASHGTILLSDGGTLNLGSDGVTKGAGNATVQLGNGTVGALAAHTWANTLSVELTGQTVFDTTGGDITLSSFLTGDGGIVKEGSGTLYINGVSEASRNTFEGSLTINEGNVTVTRFAIPTVKDIGDKAVVIIESGASLTLAGSDGLWWDAGNQGNPAMIYVNGGKVTTDGSANHHSVGNFTLTSGEIAGSRPDNDAGGTQNYIFDGTVYVNPDEDGHSTITAQRVNIRNGGTFDVAAGGHLDVTAKIGNNGGTVMTKTGDGVMTLLADNPFQGTVNVLNGTLALQNPAEGTAALNLAGGTMFVGRDADNNGTFHQISGDVSMAVLNIGVSGNSAGTYTMDGGTLTTTSNVFVGNSGDGTFNLNGGTATFGTGLYVGDAANSSGEVNITGGELTVGTTMIVGQRGDATLTQTGGTVTVNGPNGLYVGGDGNNGATAEGTYYLSGGELNATKITVRNTNDSAFIMTGGGTLHTEQFSGSVNNLGGVVDVAGLHPTEFNTMDITGNYIQGAAGQLNLKISNEAWLAGTNMDMLNVTGSLDLDGILHLLLLDAGAWTLDDVGNVSIPVFENYDASAENLEEIFAKITWSGEMVPDLMWYYSPLDGSVHLGVPEPATWVMLLLGLLAVVCRRRGRK